MLVEGDTNQTILYDLEDATVIHQIIQSSKWSITNAGLSDANNCLFHRRFLFGDDNLKNNQLVSFKNKNKLDIRRENVIISEKHIDMNKNRMMVIDIETTGLPTKTKYGMYYDPLNNLWAYEHARILSIAWVIIDTNTNTIVQDTQHYHLIKQTYTFQITNTDIHHITSKMLHEQGEDITTVLGYLYADLLTVYGIIAHNLFFDYNILLSEGSRFHNKLTTHMINMKKNKKKLVCTCKQNGYKKLSDLYEQVIGIKRESTREHCALYDMLDLAKCYLQLQCNKK